MIIRKARIEDKKIVAQLIWDAIEEQANYFTGNDTPDEILNGLEDLFTQPHNRFSYENAMIAEIDGQVAGSIIAFPGREMRSLDESILQGLMKRFPEGSPEYNRIIPAIQAAKEAHDDEFYIDNLAVLETHQGKGIGKKLIETAEQTAFERGFGKISMLAEKDNVKAFNIYKRLGYMHDCMMVSLGHEYFHLAKPL